MNPTSIVLREITSHAMLTVHTPRDVYVVHCNGKAFPFLQAAEAYSLKVHFEAVGLEADITIQANI